MDISTAIKKPFTNIKALIIGCLLSIIPIIGWFAKGYILKTSGIRGMQSTLPDWSEWGDDFVKGFASFVIKVVYLLPAIILLMIGAGAVIIAMAGPIMDQVMVQGGWENLGKNPIDEKVIEDIITQNLPAIVAAAPFVIMAVLLAVLAAYLIPAATLRYVKTGSFGSAFSVGAVFGKAFTGAYFLSALVSIIIMIAISIVLGFVPFIGPAIASFIGGVIGYTLMADAYLSTEAQNASPAAAKAPKKPAKKAKKK
jgi:hypothetical protein